jgi:hypothetical protein
MGALRVVGADTYADGTGQMRFDLFGLVPLVQSTGADVDRSALGRLVIESIWLPAALLPQPGVQWSVINDRTIAATLEVGGTSHTLTLTIDAAGQLQSAVLDRWSGEEQRFVPFGCVVHAERTFGGFTIPAQAQIGWWFGTERFEPEGMFFTFSVEQAQYQ